MKEIIITGAANITTPDFSYGIYILEITHNIGKKYAKNNEYNIAIFLKLNPKNIINKDDINACENSIVNINMTSDTNVNITLNNIVKVLDDGKQYLYYII